jgi:hypothetical protein
MPKLARVNKPHFASIVQRESVAYHGRRFAFAGVDPQAAGHAKVQHEVLLVIQRSDEILAAPPQIDNAAAGNAFYKFAHRRFVNGSGPGNVGRTQTTPDEAGTDKVLAGVLYLGQLRHRR